MRSDGHHAGLDDPAGHYLTEKAEKPVQGWQTKPRRDQYADEKRFMRELNDFYTTEFCDREKGNMNDIENGMLVGADTEWERLNADTPYDNAETPQIETYLFDQERVREVVSAICGIDADDISEEAAVAIYDHLVQSEVENALRSWFESEDRAEYDEWWHDRNDWMKEVDD